ncbi:MAG: ABC transporter permease, partial [Pseudomonadota bacterium]
MRNLLASLRRLYSHKIYSLLNICGLGISLSVCLVLALYVQHEISYDRHFTDATRLYQVGQRMEGLRNPAAAVSVSSAKVAELFADTFPEVEAVTRHIAFSNPVMLRVGEQELSEAGLRYADEQFFRVFDFPVVAGDLATALDRPDGLVLTQALAEKVFGTTDVVGRTLTVDGNTELVVTAVIAIPGNTHFSFTAMAPVALYDRTLPNPAMMSNWGALFSKSYVLLREGASVDSLTARFPGFITEQTQGSGMQFSFVTTPLTDIHLSQTFQGGAAGLTNLDRVKLFVAIAACILLIAVVNFMNLATAGASRRAREVGVKVAMGAGRARLIRQFLGESTLTVAVAMLVGLVVAEVLVLPLMNGWLQWNLQLADAPLLQGSLALAGAVVVLGLLAGSYPAFYLTAWNATKVLRGELTRGRGGQWFRGTLVVVQFTISITLIIAAVVMNVQLRYAQEFDKGFDASNVLLLRLPQTFDMSAQGDGLMQRLRNVLGVEDVSVSMASPLLEMRLRTSAVSAENPEGGDLTLLPSTDNLLELYRIPLLAGRYPGSEAVDDSIRVAGPLNDADNATALPNGGLVLSESAAQLLGWTPTEAVGRPIEMPIQQGLIKTTVIGVVADTVGGVRQGS